MNITKSGNESSVIGIKTKSERYWLFVRFFVAVILLVAAGLKAITLPSLGDGLLHNRWFSFFVVEFELFFGIWLLFGLFPKWTRLAGIFLFSLFSVVSFYKAISGAVSCGCFGDVTVPPYITTGLDMMIVFALIKARPKNDNKRFNIQSVLLIAGIYFLASVLVVSMTYSYAAQTLDENGVIYGKGNEIVFEPEQWINKRFPLIDHIEAVELPKQGTWLVLLYHHTCSACRESVKQYSKLAIDFAQKENCPKIAIVEVPPFERDTTEEDKGCPAIRGKLDKKRKWKVKTPVSILVDNGKVQNVFTNPLDTDLIQAIWGGEK